MLWTRRSFTPPRHFRHLSETEQKASMITRFARHAPHRNGGEEEKEKENYSTPRCYNSLGGSSISSPSPQHALLCRSGLVHSATRAALPLCTVHVPTNTRGSRLFSAVLRLTGVKRNYRRRRSNLYSLFFKTFNIDQQFIKLRYLRRSTTDKCELNGSYCMSFGLSILADFHTNFLSIDFVEPCNNERTTFSFLRVITKVEQYLNKIGRASHKFINWQFYMLQSCKKKESWQFFKIYASLKELLTCSLITEKSSAIIGGKKYDSFMKNGFFTQRKTLVSEENFQHIVFSVDSLAREILFCKTLTKSRVCVQWIATCNFPPLVSLKKSFRICARGVYRNSCKKNKNEFVQLVRNRFRLFHSNALLLPYRSVDM